MNIDFLEGSTGRKNNPKRSVCWIEAFDYYIKVHTLDSMYLVRDSLKNMEARLPSQFARVHKSAIINMEFIKELEPSGHGEFNATLKSGARIKVSRSYKLNVLGMNQGTND